MAHILSHAYLKEFLTEINDKKIFNNILQLNHSPD